MKILYVTRVYEVIIPNDRTAIEAAIDASNHPEDAAIIKASDEAVAMYMTYASDEGKFNDAVHYFDSYVKDVPPDVAEFKQA